MKREMVMDRLPITVLHKEILTRLDVEELCSVACVNKELRFTVESIVLPSVTCLQLSTMAPDDMTLARILRRCTSLTTLTLNCRRLYGQSLDLLTPTIRQLSLWCCSSFSYGSLTVIAHKCPNLRVLVLELAEIPIPNIFKFRQKLNALVVECHYLESLSLLIRVSQEDASFFESLIYLPRTITTLKLEPILDHDVLHLLRSIVGVTPSSPNTSKFRLRSLSLVLDVMTDELLRVITTTLPLLVELNLEDRTTMELSENHDVTDEGLQCLSYCRFLTCLSLVRGRLKHQGGTFKRVSDMGMFLLLEGCKGLESVRFGGFSKVSDASFASVLHSCLKLKKLEIRNSSLLSDLAFHDLTESVSFALEEVRLLSCRLITSETVKKLALCRRIQILDLGGCKSISDSCLSFIACLSKLTSLNLSKADITDSGLLVLGDGNLSITNLSLRGCKRVTDKGVISLLCGEGTTGQHLTALDLGYMPGITDETILAIVSAEIGIIDLCIRSCYGVTENSVKALASKRNFPGMNKQLRRLDLCNCKCLNIESLRWFKQPSFQGLHWLGICGTKLVKLSDEILAEIYGERPWLTVCLSGCEIGCIDGWHNHKQD